MIHPVEMKQPQPQELPGGYTSTTSDVWKMLTACRNGDLTTVRDLVEHCPGLVHCEYNYTTPIHFAVREGHAPLVRYLLDCGADPAYRTYRFGDSLLQMAQDRQYDEIASMLEDVLSKRFPVSAESESLLKAASEGDVAQIETLLAGDAERVRASNETGSTPLHMACAGGHFGAVRLLLDRGADVGAVDSHGFKPIHSALFTNRQGRINRPKSDSVHDIGRRFAIAGYLLGSGVQYNIFLAAVFKDLPSVRAFLAEDPGLANFEDTHHRRSLSAATWRGDLDMVRLLLEHGADPSLPESDSPRGASLWIAAFRGDVGMARLLLEHGADPESTAESGGRAIAHTRDNPELYQLLVDHGAEPQSSEDGLITAVFENDLSAVEAILAERPRLASDPATFYGEGILAMPCRDLRWEMMDLLFRHGAKVPEVSKWGVSYYFKHLDVATHLMEKGMNPNHMNWHRTTLLHDVAHAGNIEKARLLLDHGAAIDAIDEEYRSTPLAACGESR